VRTFAVFATYGAVHCQIETIGDEMQRAFVAFGYSHLKADYLSTCGGCALRSAAARKAVAFATNAQIARDFQTDFRDAGQKLIGLTNLNKA
jgi:hypothetical protein